MTHRILRLTEVKSRTGLSRSTIYLRQSEGTFPHAISLGANAVGWIEREIDLWIEAQIHRNRGAVDDLDPQQHIDHGGVPR